MPRLLLLAALAAVGIGSAFLIARPATPAIDPDRPITCGTAWPTGDTEVVLMDEACMALRVPPGELPERCLTIIDSRGATVRGYDPACMARSGFRVSGDD